MDHISDGDKLAVFTMICGRLMNQARAAGAIEPMFIDGPYDEVRMVDAKTGVVYYTRVERYEDKT